MQEPSPTSVSARADLFTALVLLALSAGVILESLGMPRYEERAVNPFSVPGLVPGVLGLALLVLAGLLLLRSLAALRSGAGRGAGPGLLGVAGGLDAALLGLLTLGYGGLLVGRLPFRLATFLFVFLFIVLFERDLPATPRQRAGRALFAFVQAAVVALGVAYVFEDVFLVRLP
ncbi:tripartite tricarboxylate transporter TctB family protein [Marinimicrococcus flavescens]|uniref:Tripartite tricarboxylate transporter TctB family protein n=1 Tax=Marinimicrococcus flavescens TaxID=3031815 RepID=A0AAP3V184_9PROT|nr:tripartite tricarboxylate transporter TctB family protein [Marinimicrococcus flavescens]